MSRVPPNHLSDRTWHKAKLRLSRTTANEGDHMSLHLTDELTGIALLSVEFSMETFAYLITGMANLPAQYQLRGAEYVGKIEEYKSFRVPVKLGDRDRKLVAFDAAQPHCIDGWMYAGPMPGGGASWSQNDWASFENPMGKGPKLTDHTVLLRFVRYVDPAPIETKPVTPVKRVRVRRPDQL